MPFFPMMLYSVCPYQYPAALASGINLFALNACGTFQAQLNALGGAAFSTGDRGRAQRLRPGRDRLVPPRRARRRQRPGREPARPAARRAQPLVPDADEPFLLGRGAAAVEQVAGFYPALHRQGRRDRLRPVPAAGVVPAEPAERRVLRPARARQALRRRSRRSSGSRPTTGSASGANNVTPATVRAESWLAIAGGAHGLGFWPAQWDPVDERGDLGRRPRRRAPRPGDLHAADRRQRQLRQIQMSARHVGRRARTSSRSTPAGRPRTRNSSIPSLNGRPLSVMGESRRVNSDGDIFSDHFAPLAVHIYIAAPPGSYKNPSIEGVPKDA